MWLTFSWIHFHSPLAPAADARMRTWARNYYITSPKALAEALSISVPPIHALKRLFVRFSAANASPTLATHRRDATIDSRKACTDTRMNWKRSGFDAVAIKCQWILVNNVNFHCMSRSFVHSILFGVDNNGGNATDGEKSFSFVFPLSRRAAGKKGLCSGPSA